MQLFHKVLVAASSVAILVQATPDLFHIKIDTAAVGRAHDALESLMTWYNQTTGRWGNDSVVPWWQSGNALQAMIDFMEKTGSREYMDEAINTIDIQRAPLEWWPQGNGEFRADSTDDTGWWALANLKMYTLTGEEEYLTIAKLDEAYMYSYRDNGSCGGGILWDIPSRFYNNAISNELYLLLAISLHNRIPGDEYYLSQALKEWDWFKNSGMINSHSLINDGLEETNYTCTNNGRQTWTYNQGVILGALTELSIATGNDSYITTARSIADAVIASPQLNPKGVLTEPCEANSTCLINEPAFKGIFVRYLSQLNEALPLQPYTGFLQTQAKSVYAFNRNATNFYGLHWAGPYVDANIASQTSALSALTAAL